MCNNNHRPITCVHRNKAIPAFLRLVSPKEGEKAKENQRTTCPLRHRYNKASKLNIGRSSLTVQELEEAEQSIIRFSQSQSFDNELKSLDEASLDELGHEQTPSQKRKNEVTKASSRVATSWWPKNPSIPLFCLGRVT